MHAQVVIAGPPTVGSANPVSAEPLVTRPATTPCKVILFQNGEFAGGPNVTFTYTPPADCPGPWAKVVFTTDFTVTAGIQYDRSPEFFLGNATLYRGTTSEPNPSQSPSWHVERDVTDLSALLTASQSGVAACGNVVDSTYTGIIYANAELDFYPVSATVPAAVVPDAVIPMVPDPTNPIQAFSTASPLTMSVTVPKNTMQLFMDLTVQTDEFWWLSTPNAQAAPYIQGVDATAFREMDVAIDGTPAGVAPNHPYIFTGGIDPYLWFPITGAQTLNLKPYRINLTPFAGVMSDGNPHTISITDLNTIGDFYLNADLFVYTDHGAATTGGALISNTLTANPATNVVANVNLDANGDGTASVTESLSRSFSISGYVNTSQGKITTTVAETVNFQNAQQLDSTDTENVVGDDLTSTVDAVVTTTTSSGSSTIENYTSNPLHAFINFVENADGTFSQTTTAELRDQYKQIGPGAFSSNAQEDVTSTDSLGLDASFNLTSQSGQASTGTYFSSDTNGNTYTNTLTAANNVLTGVTTTSTTGAVAVLLSASAATVAQGAPVTLTATLTAENNALVPTGYVTFYVNGTPVPVSLGSVLIAGNSVSLTLSSLPVGTDTITAAYSGDTTFNAVAALNSVTVTVTAVPPAFTLGAFSPTAMTLVAGQTGVLSLPITANAAYSGSVVFTCTGAPSETACLVNPGSVTLTPGQAANVSVTIATTAANNSTVADGRMPGMPKVLGGISFAGIFLLLVPRRRRRGMYALVALLGIGLCGAAGLTGCSSGAGGPKFAGTPAGTSTITVTATAGASVQTATFILTVTTPQ